MSHLKRLKAPREWPFYQRKGKKFIVRPLPGQHKLNSSITMNLILTEMLSYAKTSRECKKILNKGSVLVNGKTIKNHRFGVGLMDIISIKDTNEHFIILYDKHQKFSLFPIKKNEADDLVVRIANKTILKNKKVQLNLSNGYNLLVEKDVYKTGDSFILNKNKIKKHLKFERGALVYFIDGKHKGKSGIIEEIIVSTGFTPGKITIKSDKEKITTRKDYALVIEKVFKK